MKWDLFNPHPEYNYAYMSTKLDISTLENPNIQVIWEDTPDNFTQERIKRVRTYFEKKYGSKNVNVVTKVKSSDEEMQSVDVSMNILDENFQKDLITKYCESNLRGYSIDQQTGIYYRVTKKGDLTKSIYGQFGIGIKYIGKYIYWDENHIDGVKGTIFDALPQPYENQLIYIRSPFENIFILIVLVWFTLSTISA